MWFFYINLTALKRGEVVSFSIRFRPGTVLSTVTAVRAYALPHVLDSSELTEDTTNEATTAVILKVNDFRIAT